jgi:D-arginine dehydrogenase
MTAGTRVIVVGGGIAGVSIGFELARDHDVVVLEAEDALGFHTTGRSAALYIAEYGPAPVRTLTRASLEGFRRLERDFATPSLLTPRGALLTAWDDQSVAHLTAAVDAPGSTLVPLSAHEAECRCRVLRSDRMRLAGGDDTAMDVDVMALHAATSASGPRFSRSPTHGARFGTGATFGARCGGSLSSPQSTGQTPHENPRPVSSGRRGLRS